MGQDPAFSLRRRWQGETLADEVFDKINPEKKIKNIPPHPPQAVLLPLQGKANDELVQRRAPLDGRRLPPLPVADTGGDLR